MAAGGAGNTGEVCAREIMENPPADSGQRDNENGLSEKSRLVTGSQEERPKVGSQEAIEGLAPLPAGKKSQHGQTDGCKCASREVWGR